MKKVVAILFAVLFPICVFFGCGSSGARVLFVSPDGAPSLSVAGLMSEEFEFGGTTQYKVVSSADVGSFFATGEADAGILPLNLATKMVDYQIVSVNTFGNLYIVGLDGEGVESLLGQTLYVINLNNVPGLTVRLMLEARGIPYTLNELEGSAQNVVLKGVNATDVAGGFVAGRIACAVVAEPMCSKLLNMNANLKIVADVQEVYGQYPQSVFVVKKGRFKSADVARALEIMGRTISADTALNAINAHLEKGLVSAFTEDLLTDDVITKCNVGVLRANENKAFINDYIDKIIALQPNSAVKLTDDRFYV